jgi:hypothetical protein
MMKKYAASFPGEKAYPIGRINSMVYPVEGGMEDWLYAAGWDKANLKVCEGTTTEEIMSSNNRAIVYLVETSDMKKPSEASLGYAFNPLSIDSPGNGHVARNLRLSLEAIDLLEPYICLTQIDSYDRHFDISWRSGGVITVDQSFAAWHRAPDEAKSFGSRHDYWSWLDTPGEGSSPSFHLRGSESSPHNYVGQAALLCKDDDPVAEKASKQCIRRINLETVTGSIDGPDHSPVHNTSISAKYLYEANQWKALDPGIYYLVIWEKYDSNWMDPNQGEPANLQPQSHLANTRGNASYYAEAKSTPATHSDLHHRIIQGRSFWPSDYILVEVHYDRRISVRSYVDNCQVWTRKQIPLSNKAGVEVIASSTSLNVTDTIPTSASSGDEHLQQSMTPVVSFSILHVVIFCAATTIILRFVYLHFSNKVSTSFPRKR